MAVQTVQTTDGGRVDYYVETVSSSENQLYAQKYDSSGGAVGSQYSVKVSAAGPYEVVALSNGGYVVAAHVPSFAGAHFRGAVISADGGLVTTISGGRQADIAASPDGGMLVTWVEATGAASPNSLINLYDNSGQPLGSGAVYSPDARTPTISVDTDGRFVVSWQVGERARELVVDPLDPPDFTSPSARFGLIDNVPVGTANGFSSGFTNDTTPDFRVNVSEIGWVSAGFNGDPGGAFYEVTAAHVAQGYIDIPYANARIWGAVQEGQNEATVRVEDADGFVRLSRMTFTVDATPPGTPAITKAVDNQGAVQGDLASGATTDDTTLTFQITGSGLSSSELATVILMEGSQKLAEGMFASSGGSVTTSALTPGTHTVYAQVVDRAGNYSAPSATFTVTIGTDAPPQTGEGQVITSPGPGSALAGGSGSDTLIASQGPDQLTGGAGGDHFVYQALPWSAGKVTDFTDGADRIDLTALYQASGYTGANAVADSYVRFESDGAGGTRVMYDTDGAGSGQAWAYRITTLQGVAPSALSNADLVGGSSGGNETQPGGGETASGQVIRADQPGDTLAGGSGADSLYASQGPDQLTGGGGADQFAFEALPWRAGVVTDFADGSDKIDLRALLQASGYTGADAVADRYVSFESDGAGGTKVMYDTDGAGSGQAWSYHITTLQGVTASSLSNADLVGGSTGGNQTQPGGGETSSGQVLTADQPGDTLGGGAGNDTLNASQGPDQLTGAGGADRFVFGKAPWNAGVITDFAPGSDKIDVSALLDAYAGSNPIADGWLRLDEAGGSTKVYVDIDGAGGEWPFLITTLQGVAPSGVGLGNFVL